MNSASSPLPALVISYSASVLFDPARSLDVDYLHAPRRVGRMDHLSVTDVHAHVMNVACSALVGEVQQIPSLHISVASDRLAACELGVLQLLSRYGVAGYGDAMGSVDGVGKS